MALNTSKNSRTAVKAAFDHTKYLLTHVHMNILGGSKEVEEQETLITL